jgi:rhodanese-related sulfurtransferase/rubrerythrin
VKNLKTYGFDILSSEKVKQYINNHHEQEYMIIDVRQPFEYETNHIPGALLNPLQQLIKSFSDLPIDKDLIFYCHVGSRSQMAAMMAAEEGAFKNDIYSLEGGIAAWTGKSLENLPRVGVFNKSKTLTEFLYTAMNMEKGAERFYRLICEKYPSEAFDQVFSQMAGAETAHAKLIYNIYKKNVDFEPVPFDEFFKELAGDIIEGGGQLDRCVDQLESISENPCSALMDLALDIEFAAFDLYRTLANQKTDDSQMAGVFLDIAQAEKSHMRMISAALDLC